MTRRNVSAVGAAALILVGASAPGCGKSNEATGMTKESASVSTPTSGTASRANVPPQVTQAAQDARRKGAVETQRMNEMARAQKAAEASGR